jgi:serine/threonine-protein kinase
MMYEMLTGHVPFEGDNWLAVMAGHLRRTPERIRDTRPEVSSELEAVVLKAMRRYPKNRYQTAEELLQDFEHLDRVDVRRIDLSPEEPMGGMGTPAATNAAIWMQIALIAIGFIVVCAVVITLSVLLKK